MSHAIGRARGLTYGLTALLTLGLLAGSPGVAVASPDSVDRVVSTIAKNIDAGSWKVAAANIDALDVKRPRFPAAPIRVAALG